MEVTMMEHDAYLELRRRLVRPVGRRNGIVS